MATNRLQHRKIANMRQAANGKAQQAEFQLGLKLGELLRSARAAGQRIGYQSDLMPTGDLLSREIFHMTKKAADWRAQDMHDTKRLCIGNRWGNKGFVCTAFSHSPGAFLLREAPAPRHGRPARACPRNVRERSLKSLWLILDDYATAM
jgi:hypothetical protein